MVLNQIQNREIKSYIVDSLGLSEVADNLPNTLSPGPITPVYEIDKPIANLCIGGGNTTSGALTVYTTPSANADFYLTTLHASYVKNATCDVASGRLQVTAQINGVVIELIGFPVLTTTAQQEDTVISFPYPIKLDRGTSISFTGTFTAGNMCRTGNITGYIIRGK